MNNEQLKQKKENEWAYTMTTPYIHISYLSHTSLAKNKNEWKYLSKAVESHVSPPPSQMP